jgi:hypothetical protein
MVDTVTNLRTIRIVLHGREHEMVTIGHLARALGRTVWTVKSWEQLGLLPRAAFVLNPNSLSARRRLYPPAYVDALQEIRKQGYLGRRLDRDQWQRFHAEVWAAYQATVTPLLARGVGVTGNPPDRPDDGGQAQGPS